MSQESNGIDGGQEAPIREQEVTYPDQYTVNANDENTETTFKEVQKEKASGGIRFGKVTALIAAIVIVVVVAGVGVGAYFIGQNNGAASSMPSFTQGQFGDMPEGGASLNTERPEDATSFMGGMGMDYSMFVDAGIIDQETANEMEEYMQGQMPSQMPTQTQSRSAQSN